MKSVEIKSEEENWLLDDQEPESEHQRVHKPWKILVADDEPDVHTVTRLALRHMKFHDRGLEILSAFSAHEAYQMLNDHPDTAVLLLDVVMETPDAGLQLVHRIRQELGNQLVRIVLRTGQPGQAPEQEVIVNYDINDYKAKTELTTQKLYTTVVASLRAYESLYALENHRIGMHKIIKASSDLYRINSLRDFASGLLKQINALLGIGIEGSLCVLAQRDNHHDQQLCIIAGTGAFDGLNRTEYLATDHPSAAPIQKVLQNRQHQYTDFCDILYVPVRCVKEFVVYLTPSLPLNQVERSLIELFCDRMALAFDNLWLNNQLKSSQMGAVALLSSLAENPEDPRVGPLQHVRGLLEAFAQHLLDQGKYTDVLDRFFVEHIGMAFLLHDLGKISMQHEMLLQKGPLSPQERQIMQQHTETGRRLLDQVARAESANCGNELMLLAAEIAYGHHERFDGTGYPQGLKGEEIPLSARIASFFDVYEALIRQKPYKNAWSEEEACAYIQSQAGLQFDPQLTDLFLNFIRNQQKQEGNET